jgi:hypothetical protein
MNGRGRADCKKKSAGGLHSMTVGIEENMQRIRVQKNEIRIK